MGRPIERMREYPFRAHGALKVIVVKEDLRFLTVRCPNAGGRPSRRTAMSRRTPSSRGIGGTGGSRSSSNRLGIASSTLDAFASELMPKWRAPSLDIRDNQGRWNRCGSASSARMRRAGLSCKPFRLRGRHLRTRGWLVTTEVANIR
jgi:hypothetical protein